MSGSTEGALRVVIDGPAGAGKTTVARAVGRALNLPLLDTGAIYRTLAWVAKRDGIEWSDEAALAGLCEAFPITFQPAQGDGPQRVLYGSEDVTAEIRTPAISQGASKVSAHPRVRAALLDIQRALGGAGCVAEGRDMGTVVFPDADFKFFLTADVDTRAKRRHADLVATEQDPVPSIESLRAQIAERDSRDSTRATAPLTQADDAVRVDSSALPLQQVIEHILGVIEAGPRPASDSQPS